MKIYIEFNYGLEVNHYNFDKVELKDGYLLIWYGESEDSYDINRIKEFTIWR